MNLAKKFVFVFSLLLTSVAFAQTVKVTKETSKVKGDNLDGYAVELEGSVDDVTSALSKYIRSFAKLKLAANPMTTSELVIGGTSYKSPVYAKVSEKGQGAEAWMGLKESEWPDQADAEKVMKELKRLMYDFGIKYYRDKIQVQIDESTRALQAAEKQQQRLLTDNKNLNVKLENNAKEKIQLEKALENNKLLNLSLLTQLDQNVKSQDSVAVVAEQIKKVVEMHKERQKKVN
jgi:hypothetical protein